MDAAAATDLCALVDGQLVAALGTLHTTRNGVEPFVSMVPVAWVLAPSSLAVIHVSALAPHTRDLQRNPGVSLMLTAMLAPDVNPQALARLTVQARAIVLEPGSVEWAAAQAAYLARFPKSEQTFALGDFQLVALQPVSARFVAGFGRAHGLTAAALASLLSR
jgi:putative heme iron utilization protein